MPGYGAAQVETRMRWRARAIPVAESAVGLCYSARPPARLRVGLCYSARPSARLRPVPSGIPKVATSHNFVDTPQRWCELPARPSQRESSWMLRLPLAAPFVFVFVLSASVALGQGAPAPAAPTAPATPPSPDVGTPRTP